jgi:hypothetical protein
MLIVFLFRIITPNGCARKTRHRIIYSKIDRMIA